MSKIEINTQIEMEDYIKLMFQTSYKRPIMLYLTIFGFIMLVFGILNVTGLLVLSESSPLFALVFGFFTVVYLPISIYIRSKKNYKSNGRLQENIKYSFGKEEMNISGSSFNSTLTWDKTYMVKELKNWILLYQTKQVMNIIPKESFSDNQLSEFRELVRGIPSIKKKLRN